MNGHPPHTLVLNADNGLENNGARTQWLKRLVAFSAAQGVTVKLACYPRPGQRPRADRGRGGGGPLAAAPPAGKLRPLLRVPWSLDIDSTVKSLCSHQEGAIVGYIQHERGRPSRVYHTYLMGTTRSVLNMEMRPDKQTVAHHALPGLWRLLAAFPAAAQPLLRRGDGGFG